MTHPLFEKHRPVLDAALQAIQTRGYWAAFGEQPSPKTYGPSAAEDGKRAFEAHLGQRFELSQPGQSGWHGGEQSPYGVALAVQYPVCEAQALIAAAEQAMGAWQQVGAEGRTGICIEMLQRLNQQSFELAHAVCEPQSGWLVEAAVLQRLGLLFLEKSETKVIA